MSLNLLIADGSAREISARAEAGLEQKSEKSPRTIDPALKSRSGPPRLSLCVVVSAVWP